MKINCDWEKEERRIRRNIGKKKRTKRDFVIKYLVIYLRESFEENENQKTRNFEESRKRTRKQKTIKQWKMYMCAIAYTLYSLEYIL